MSQNQPASTIALDAAQDAQGVFEAIVADGLITLDEVVLMRRTLIAAVTATSRADLARAIGVCAQRGGPEGDRFTRLMAAWEEYNNRPTELSENSAQSMAPIAIVCTEPLSAA